MIPPLMCLLPPLALMYSATPGGTERNELRLAGLYLLRHPRRSRRMARRVMSRPERITVTFSAVTRNALIIYPCRGLCAQRLAQAGT